MVQTRSQARAKAVSPHAEKQKAQVHKKKQARERSSATLDKKAPHSCQPTASNGPKPSAPSTGGKPPYSNTSDSPDQQNQAASPVVPAVPAVPVSPVAPVEEASPKDPVKATQETIAAGSKSNAHSSTHSQKRRRSDSESRHDIKKPKTHASASKPTNPDPVSRKPADPKPVSPKPADFKPGLSKLDPVSYWVEQGHWPERLFGMKMKEDYARPRAPPSSRKRSRSGSALTPVTSSDPTSLQESYVSYSSPQYITEMKDRGSFPEESPLGIADESKEIIDTLLSSPQTFPQGTLFDDHTHQATCNMITSGNEARVMYVLTPLLIPSAECLAISGLTDLQCLIDGHSEGWNNCICFFGTRPQPDYCVGFQKYAFTKEQHQLLAPYIGSLAHDESFFLATSEMYFPFLMCEVKSGAVSLDIAGRQNSHSATIAVRAIVKLFHAVNRQQEIDRQVLAFSISHNSTMVQIYGHYAVIDGEDVEYFRHPICSVSFALSSQKWLSYQFVKNVYEIWMPMHLKRIRSAIDQLRPPLPDEPALLESEET